MPAVIERPEFIADVLGRIEWLARYRPEEQLDHFLGALMIVRDQIARGPLRGSPLRQDERHVMRMRLFPRPLPYLVHYAHAKREPITEVYLVRLYASGQDRPGSDMSGGRGEALLRRVRPLERGASAGDPAADRGHGAALDVGDLFIGVALECVEQ